ncbi:MAG: alpha/beta hydrolase [Actinomycetota bacterium]|nr:alpha/beta hydrolase [Actinomycetota bacterium]
MNGAGTPETWRLGQRAELPLGTVAVNIFGDGPPVVLVHGTPTWSYLWRHVGATLADKFTVYVYDLLGYGDSPAPPDADVSVRAQARLLADLLEFWGLDEPAIAGHDIGGAAVLRAHLMHKCAFRRIALIDAVALRPWITPTTRHVQAHLPAYGTMPVHIYEQIVATHLRTAVYKTFDDAAFDAYLDRWKGRGGQAAYLQKVAQFNEDHTSDFEPKLKTMRTPVRIIWGEHDAWLDRATADRLHDLIPGSQLSFISGAGHFCMEDAPQDVAQELVEFFSTEIANG